MRERKRELGGCLIPALWINLHAAKDRLRSLNDYRVNLKAELEIRHLHEKVDHLISKQWQRLAEIQELQIELMQERHYPGAAD